MSNVPTFAGPGTAAFFGAAIVFFAVVWTGNTIPWYISLIGIFGGLVLMVAGRWIELLARKERVQRNRESLRKQLILNLIERNIKPEDMKPYLDAIETKNNQIV